MQFKIIVVTIIFLGSLRAAAQDPNFSQAANLPALTNPAGTGNFDGDWRLSGHFRNTSFDAAHAYTSGALVLEKRIKGRGVIPEQDVLGIGFHGLFDQSGSGALKSNYIGLSVAYAKALDLQGNSTLAAGLQGVWATRRLNVNQLVFEDQFTSGGYAYSLPSADAYKGGSLNYLDVNAGLAYRYDHTNYGWHLGASLFHSNRPAEQFWGDDYHIPARYSVQGGGYFPAGEMNRVYLEAISNFQDGAKEHLLGGYYSVNMNDLLPDSRLNLGTFWRVQNALVPYLGVAMTTWKAALSYDVNIARQRMLDYKRRSLELNVSCRL